MKRRWMNWKKFGRKRREKNRPRKGHKKRKSERRKVRPRVANFLCAFCAFLWLPRSVLHKHRFDFLALRLGLLAPATCVIDRLIRGENPRDSHLEFGRVRGVVD